MLMRGWMRNRKQRESSISPIKTRSLLKRTRSHTDMTTPAQSSKDTDASPHISPEVVQERDSSLMHDIIGSSSEERMKMRSAHREVAQEKDKTPTKLMNSSSSGCVEYLSNFSYNHINVLECIVYYVICYK